MSYTSHGSLPFLAPNYTGIDVTSPFSEWSHQQDDLHPPFTFVGLPERQEVLLWVRQAFPQGAYQQDYGADGEMIFWTYEVGR
jgi:hypothetical protein